MKGASHTHLRAFAPTPSVRVLVGGDGIEPPTLSV